MKIKQEHYNYLKDRIEAIVNHNGYERVIKYYESLKQLDDVKNPKIRLMYDLERRSIESGYITSVLYEYMNDSHITTALLKIGSELKLF